MNSEMERIVSLVSRAPNALIGSVDEEGYPNVKAMLPPRKREGLERIYFSTNTSSKRVAQFRENPKASLYFYDPNSFQGVMLKGEMEVVEEFKYKEMLWQAGDEIYYPLGVTDSDYCVLIFHTKSLRYYTNMNSFDLNF